MIRGSDVTVVIPTIEGREEFVLRALRSVEAQEIKPGEVILWPDSDRVGAWHARNQAIEKVKTDWIAWLDDDDELLPNHLKVLVRAANKTGADLIFSYAEFVGGRDPLACWIGHQLIPRPINVPWGPDAEYSLRYKGNFIPITYLVRTDLVRRVGGFPKPYSFQAVASGECEDYGLLLRLLDHGAKFHHVTGVRTWRYHIHGANTGGRGSDRLHELA